MISHTCLIDPAFNPELVMVSLADCPVEAPTDVMGISAPVAASKPTPATSADVRTRPFGIRSLIMPAVLQKSARLLQ